VDLEINRKAHLNASVQNNERPLVFKQKEIKFSNQKKDTSGVSVNSKINYVNDYVNNDSIVNG